MRPVRVSVCGPEYYVYTLREWLRYIGEVLEEWGIHAEAVYGVCDDVVIEVCGVAHRGLPDNEGVLLELILNASAACGG